MKQVVLHGLVGLLEPKLLLLLLELPFVSPPTLTQHLDHLHKQRRRALTPPPYIWPP